MATKRKRFHDHPAQWFWVEYEHPDYGTVKVTFKWEPSGNGAYHGRIDSVEFDLFTPPDVQREMMQEIEDGRFRMVSDA